MITEYIRLIRVRQWYKNWVIFLALFFVGQFFSLTDLALTIAGFFALALVSSANYIINDIIDRDKDRNHPEKKNRPLASGRVSVGHALWLSIILLMLGGIIAWNLQPSFFIILMLLFTLSQGYNVMLKNIVFADILTIATLFVLRAVAGAVLLQVKVSPWLILCPFFLSLFLSVGKRHADVKLLEEKAEQTRKVLKDYNEGITSALMIISTTLLIISYALYSFLSDHKNLLFTLPFALFVIFRYFSFVYSGSVVARHPEKIFFDRPIMVGVLLWGLMTFVILYFPQISFDGLFFG